MPDLRIPHGDRVPELRHATFGLHPGWVLMALEQWHPAQPGPPGQSARTGAAGTIRNSPTAMLPADARRLAAQLLQAADLAEGRGASH